MQLFPNQQSYPNNTQFHPYASTPFTTNTNTQFQSNATGYYRPITNTQHLPTYTTHNPYQIQQVSHEKHHHHRRFDSPEDLARFLLPFVYPPNYYSPYYQPYYQPYSYYQPYPYNPYYQQYPYNSYYPYPYVYASDNQFQSAQPVQGHFEDSHQDELV